MFQVPVLLPLEQRPNWSIAVPNHPGNNVSILNDDLLKSVRVWWFCGYWKHVLERPLKTAALSSWQ
jgi:hypothetical protein